MTKALYVKNFIWTYSINVRRNPNIRNGREKRVAQQLYCALLLNRRTWSSPEMDETGTPKLQRIYCKYHADLEKCNFFSPFVCGMRKGYLDINWGTSYWDPGTPTRILGVPTQNLLTLFFYNLLSTGKAIERGCTKKLCWLTGSWRNSLACLHDNTTSLELLLIKLPSGLWVNFLQDLDHVAQHMEAAVGLRISKLLHWWLKSFWHTTYHMLHMKELLR